MLSPFVFQFASCFLQFLKDSSPVFAEKVERLVRRTFISGTRGFPPSWLEFQVRTFSAEKLMKPRSFIV